jgi:hypothetical protein
MHVPGADCGNMGRDSFRSRGINKFDLSFSMRFALSEGRWLEFRTNLFERFQTIRSRFTTGISQPLKPSSLTPACLVSEQRCGPH